MNISSLPILSEINFSSPCVMTLWHLQCVKTALAWVQDVREDSASIHPSIILVSEHVSSIRLFNCFRLQKLSLLVFFDSHLVYFFNCLTS